MASANLNLSRPYPEGSLDTPSLVFWLLTSAFTLTTVELGGTQFVLLWAAVGLAIIVWVRPCEAPGIAMLYLFGASIFLPFASRFPGSFATNWQMYYWAVGLLIITLAAVLRIGLGRVWLMPRSAKVFFFVALAASVYAASHGVSGSYILRQLYGSALLVVYLSVALHVGSEELLIRRIATLGVMCAVCFLIYYAAVFSEYGFHKEAGSSGAQATLLAIPLLVTALQRKKVLWALGAMTFILLPVLLFMRRDVLEFIFAVPLAVAFTVKSRKTRVACYAVAGLIAVPALYPPVTVTVAREVQHAPVVGHLIPGSARGAGSLVGRVLELDAAVRTLRTHPMLGEGMGAVLVFEKPSGKGVSSGGYVDSGWGYVIQKMGLTGLVTFVWLLWTILGAVSRRSPHASVCVLTAACVMLFSEPVFFHFTTAPFLGTYGGLLLAERRRRKIHKARAAARRMPAAA